MSEDKLQKDEFYLKGDLGTIRVAHTGQVVGVKEVNINKTSGCVTLTLGEVVAHYLNGIPVTEDIDCEVIPPKQIEDNSLT